MDIPHVLVDTGSAATLLAADIVAALGIVPLPEDILHTLRGVGGTDWKVMREYAWEVL
jgi:hypothetical protein